jgi:hypothetical protein
MLGLRSASITSGVCGSVSIEAGSSEGLVSGGLNSWMSVAPLDRADARSAETIR